MAKEEEQVDVELSEETLKLLKRRKVNSKGVGCFLCSMILEDHAKHEGKLTDYPIDAMGKGVFPVMAKVIHVDLEKNSQDVDKIVVPPAGPYPPTKPRPEPSEKQRALSKKKVDQRDGGDRFQGEFPEMVE